MVDVIEGALFGNDVTDNLVYHYTTRETALEKILPSGEIMLNVLEKTNDPREYLNWSVTVVGGSDDMKPFWQTCALVNKNRKHKTKVFCLTLDDLEPKRFGLLRRGFARSRMWAQYGEKHKGMCLVFDKSALEAEIIKTAVSSDNCFCRPVQYTDQDFGIELNFNSMGESESEILHGVDLYIRENVDRLFFTKLHDWRDEMEYRAMIYDERTSPVFAAIGSCLKGIVLGPEFSPVYYPIAKAFGRRYAVDIGVLNWLAGPPGCVTLLGREEG